MGAVQNQIHGKELLRVRVQDQTRNLIVLRGNGSTGIFDAHPLVDAFNAEHGTKLIVVSHQVADVACTNEEIWRSLPAFPVNASIAYEKPGVKLGKEIVFTYEGNPRIVLATGKYNGERDVALVTLGVTSADFQKDGNSIVLTIPEERLICVPNFPGPDGYYMPHEPTGIPQGKKVDSEISSARYLYRLNDSSYVGLPVRGDDDYVGRRDVVAGCLASCRHGVVAEVPEGDVAKIEALVSAPKSSQPTAKTDQKAVIEVPGVSLAKLSDLYEGATGAVEKMNGVVDAQLLAPLREFLDAIGKAQF